ncbi:fibrous sheath CABYR-binding protein-like [Frankliniella occidentalis]|uniref:Fibrous sheath CABYR-binding protein-like n=1 Tax=Frankliniella occidentalis TaxID=133901 RepID=A0A9C6WYA7_FRAOC|nr:fibrous sheath CABYR-binding protein-like [Frankliniella occidentalis]
MTEAAAEPAAASTEKPTEDADAYKYDKPDKPLQDKPAEAETEAPAAAAATEKPADDDSYKYDAPMNPLDDKPSTEAADDDAYKYDAPANPLDDKPTEAAPAATEAPAAEDKFADDDSYKYEKPENALEDKPTEAAPEATEAPAGDKPADDGSYKYDTPEKPLEEAPTSVAPEAAQEASTPAPEAAPEAEGYIYPAPTESPGAAEAKADPDMKYLPPASDKMDDAKAPDMASPQQNEDGSYNYDKPSKTLESGSKSEMPDMKYLPPADKKDAEPDMPADMKTPDMAAPQQNEDVLFSFLIPFESFEETTYDNKVVVQNSSVLDSDKRLGYVTKNYLI